ncbi:MAG: DUF4838 domain-containing protein [Candidatus Hydrogenedentota bacterium]
MKRLSLLLLIALCTLTGASVYAQETPVYTDEPSGGFLRSWLLLGPIALEGSSDGALEEAHLAGFQTDHIGEPGAVAPKPGDTVQVAGETLAWRRYDSPADIVDLDAAISKEDNVAAYAYAEIQQPEKTLALLSLGSNDGCRVWLNGEQVHDHPAGRGLTLDEDQVPLLLAKGVNRLLIKVEERGNQWALAVRLRPFDTAALGERLELFDIRLRGDGDVQLRFRHGEAISKALVASGTLTLLQNGTPVWSGDWNRRYRMDIPAASGTYAEYTLEAALELSGGGAYEQTLYFATGTPTDYPLFSNGQSAYTIVIPEEATESIAWAAEELQHWLMEAGAPELPIVTAGNDVDGPVLAVGLEGIPKDRIPAHCAPGAEAEAFLYQNDGPDIHFKGSAQRGAMYAVLTFLEREVGVRWYTPAVTVVPKRESLTFRSLNHADAPGIRVRNDFYYEAFDPTWAARNKVNGALGCREQIGGIECYWAVHTFFPLVPPEEFFEEHPEYYSLIDDERVYERAQLCLTNPDVLDIVTERLRERMRQSPEFLIYSVSQNDWRQPCQCENCQAIAEREGSEAGPLIWFVNQVAERVEDEFPDKFVGTLAYQYTRTPPKTLKPRDNVVIRLCSIECCFAHPFYDECPKNAAFLDDMRGWAAIAPHLYIWDYVVNFSHYIMPYPNFPVLKPNIQAFQEYNAIGIMEQAAYQSRGGEFAELRSYVIARLLWDPEADVEAIIDDFMYGYYRRAGQYVREYFDLVHAQVTPDTHFGLGLGPNDALYSDTFVHEAGAIFDQAEIVADNTEIRHRVQMARLPVMYLKCLRDPVRAVLDGTYARFSAIAKREGITHYAERGAEHRKAFHQRMQSVEAP